MTIPACPAVSAHHGDRRARCWQFAVLALAAVAVLAACSSTGLQALDGRAIERDLTRHARVAYAGIPVGPVTCPRRLLDRPGLTFDCTVTLAGAPLRVHATRKGSTRRFTFTATAAVLTKAALERFVASRGSIPNAADCGPSPVKVIPPGGTTLCQVLFFDGGRQGVRVHVIDTLGTVSLEAT